MFFIGSSLKNSNITRMIYGQKRTFFITHTYFFNILGIESSCDDTGAAIVTSERTVLAHALHSQKSFTVRMGGVIPNLSAHIHQQNIKIIVDKCIHESKLATCEINAIAITVMPGFKPSLQVGIKYATSLSSKYNIPLIPIHHMNAHALTIRLIEKTEFPYLLLLISGGHCLLAVARGVDDFLLLGYSLDVAPGDIFDKLARRLKLHNLPDMEQISGGEAVERIARDSENVEIDSAFKVKDTMLHTRDCNFSFGGIWTPYLRIIQRLELQGGYETGDVLADAPVIAAACQNTISKHLCRRVSRAMTYCEDERLLNAGNWSLVVSGGVASNSSVRNRLQKLCKNRGYKLLAPPPHLCTDNGIMIAWNGVEKLKHYGSSILCHHDNDQLIAKAKAPFGVDISGKVKCAKIKNAKLEDELQ